MGFEVGFLLDRQWHWVRGEPERTKRDALLALGRCLADQCVSYAIIGDLALQVHAKEPRTAIQIDVAVLSRNAIPRDAMTEAGFRFGDAFEHSENWSFADGTPVQFSDDPAFASAIGAAGKTVLDDVPIA
jgi:hypothetical protein